jgi:hypothetical protein
MAVFVLLGNIVMTISTVLLAVAALFMQRAARRLRLCVVPALAHLASPLTLHLVDTYHFVPSA